MLGRKSTSSPSTSSPKMRNRASDTSHDNHSIMTDVTTHGRQEVQLGEQKVIAALVGRLVNKLPCNSGIRLGIIEVDIGVQATLQALLKFATMRLSMVVNALVAALENLSKHFSSAKSYAEIPLQFLHSQAFLLQTLHLCLDASWRPQALSDPPPPTDIPKCWPDPQPLDDHTARHLLHAILLYIKIVSLDASAATGPSSPAPSREARRGSTSVSAWGQQDLPSIHSASFGIRFLKSHSFTTSSHQRQYYRSKPLSTSCPDSKRTIRQMSKYLSRITFHLSASNWPLVFSRIHGRIGYLTTTIEEQPDVVELRLLEWCNLNRSRLGQVIQEASSAFLHVKRPAQGAFAAMLREAIWVWIEVYPSEYAALIESNRKLEGNPETLFDILYSPADINLSGSKRVQAFYPLMAMLLVVTPDVLKKVVMGDMGSRGNSAVSKKQSFLENLRKGGLSNSRAFEACTSVYVHLLWAAMSLPPRLEGSGARTIAVDIQGELKDALLNSPHAHTLADHNIAVHGIVALYRANPSHVLGKIFPTMFVDPSDAMKLLALQACVLIVEEDGKLPWHAPALDLRSVCAPLVRTLLRAKAKLVVGDQSGRRPQVTTDLPASQSDLICEALKLFAIDPMFAADSRPHAENHVDGFAETLSTISTFTVQPSPEPIRSAASLAVLALLEFAETSDLKSSASTQIADAGHAFWNTIIDTSRQALFAFHTGNPGDIEPATLTFRSAVLAVQRFAEVRPDVLADSPSCVPATVLATVVGILALAWPDIEQSPMESSSLSALAKLVEIGHRSALVDIRAGASSGFPGQMITVRIALLDELASLPLATGRQQQSRAVRRALKPYARPTIIATSVWLGLATYCKFLTEKIVAANADQALRDGRRKDLTADIRGLDEVQSRIWQTFIPLLCTCAGSCVYTGPPPPSLASLVGKETLPRVFDENSDPLGAMHEFLQSCVELFSSASIPVRETVKEALGAELPSALFPALVSRMSTSMAQHSKGSVVTDASTDFIETAVSVLRLSVDRFDASDNLKVDLTEILLLLARYTHKLGREDAALRIKTKLAQLIESVLAKPNVVILDDNDGTRNNLLEWIVDWPAVSNRDVDVFSAGAMSSKSQRDLEYACLRAVAAITDGLVLRSAGDESDPLAERSRLFYRHYSLLVSIISHPTNLENGSAPSPSTYSQSIHLKASRPEDISSFALKALANLLAANADVGLKHCLALGYHEDITLRTAFMQILAVTMKNGSRFGSPQGKQVPSTPRVFLDLLTGGDLAMAVAVCEVCPPNEIDEISLLLFRSCEVQGNLLALLRVLLEREVLNTNHESELFRGNSITTRILTVFGRAYGYNYCRATLQPLLQSLLSESTDCSFELDPVKAPAGEDIDRNADHLRMMCQALLDMICSPNNRVPPMIGALCNIIWEVVEPRFPESRHSSVGSFIFLRFFCPAIVAPEHVDIEAPIDSREIRRALLMITKVIQNLANNVTFGNKEPHMKVLNSFLSENIRQVTKYLSELASRPPTSELQNTLQAYRKEAERSQDVEGDEAILQRFISRHRPKLEAALENMPPTYHFLRTADVRSQLNGKAVLQSLRHLLSYTALATEATALNPITRASTYEEFMGRNRDYDTGSVASVFYEGPACQDGRRIFYFIVAQIALVDLDLLAFHVFQLLDDTSDLFDLVIDFTDFSASTELPIAWLKRCLLMCPPDLLASIHTLAVYNPNSYTRKRLRKIVSELSSLAPTIGRVVVAASTPTELSDYIAFTSHALPKFTETLAWSSKHLISNALLLGDRGIQAPVVVKLGPECLQVASWRPQEITSSLKAFTIDLIHLGDIDDVISGAADTNDHLTIRYLETETATFISPDREEIATIIRAARGRFGSEDASKRAVRPSDTPGTLLNVALVNLTSGDEALRMGAYNLIQELTQYYKYDVTTQMVTVTAGLSLPSNSVAFACKISKALATAVPQITLDFLREWCFCFNRIDPASRSASLQYVAPWLVNLDLYSKPAANQDIGHIQQTCEIVRTLISLTVLERTSRTPLLIQDRIWSIIAKGSNYLRDIVVAEVLQVALSAGLGSEKAECAGEILVTMSSLSVRGKLVARLRKTLAQTYLKTSTSLVDSTVWPDICTLARLNLVLSFNTESSLDTQLFLPELLHVISLTMAVGSLLMRQTMYGLLVNMVHCLATNPCVAEMDGPQLHALLQQAQRSDVIAAFGLQQVAGSLELSGVAATGESEHDILSRMEKVAIFLGDVLSASAISMDCANAWRARWMGLAAATCFQHNPATQPQAFTVFSRLADEVDDDLIYQILMAMSTSLLDFSESQHLVIISMLHCLARAVPGLEPGIRYSGRLFWLAIGVLQLGYIPLNAAALDLALVSLKAIRLHTQRDPIDEIMSIRANGGDAVRKLDHVCGVSFSTDSRFSVVAVVFKSVRHPATRASAVDLLVELLEASTLASGATDITPRVTQKGVPFFVALLPIVALSPPDTKRLFTAARIDVKRFATDNLVSMPVFDLLSPPDNSTALLTVAFVSSLLIAAGSDAEKAVLYRFMADAATVMPEIVSMMYDTLIPRMTATLATTTNEVILNSITQILERAMADSSYTFPSILPNALSESQSFNGLHRKSYDASLSSSPSMQTMSEKGSASKDQVLEDLAMKGLGELNFPTAKMERVAPMARWVASLIQGFAL